MLRVVVYIDGQNFHHSVADLKIDSYAFDFRGYLLDLTKNWPIESLHIKYYGATYPREVDEYRHNRDNQFHDHLVHNQNVVIRKGKFNYDRTGNRFPPREKGVDVLLAVDLIVDGFHRAYDRAVIISNDTDLIPAVMEAKKTHSSVEIYNLSRNPLHDFRQACHKAYIMHDGKLKKYHRPQDQPPSESLLAMLAKKNW